MIRPDITTFHLLQDFSMEGLVGQLNAYGAGETSGSNNITVRNIQGFNIIYNPDTKVFSAVTMEFYRGYN